MLQGPDELNIFDCQKNQDDRTIRVACRAFEDGQTGKCIHADTETRKPW